MSFAEFGHVYALQDQVKAEDKVLVEATKSPIVLGLGATDALIGEHKAKTRPCYRSGFCKGKYYNR